MMVYDPKNEWTALYKYQNELSYPAEGVIRILKGVFPGLLIPKPCAGKILDLGCGGELTCLPSCAAFVLPDHVHSIAAITLL